VVSQLRHPLPRGGVLLATPPKAASPQTRHVVAEGAQRRTVSRHGVVGEEPSDDLLQPAPLIGDRLMHPPSQLFLNFLELCPHRSGRVFRFSWKWPCRDWPQMNVKPRKLKVSGLPSPRCLRVTAAKRPNS